MTRRDQCLTSAARFATIKEWRAAHPADYGYAHRNGFLAEATAHMRRIRVTRDMYSNGRHCTQCKTHQPMENFPRLRKGSNVRRAQCWTCHNLISAAWRSDNPDKARRNVSESAKRNPETGRRMSRLSRQRYPESHAAREMLKRVLKITGQRKNRSTIETLGYGPDELRTHIEALFEPGMSWANRGEWHIDHIKPVCIFIREGITDPAVINALSNLRPLWAAENLSRFRRNWSIDN